MILRFLNWQGIAGLAATVALAVLLVVARTDARHWRKQSGQFEQLYHREQAAFADTVANYRAAAATARAADEANATRVATEQRAINERTADDFAARLAAARDAARRLRVEPQPAADPGARRSAPVPGLSTAAASADRAAGENRLPPSDALTATEQAIQLDELIRWVKRQAAVEVQAKP
jgi:ClpP class serine protease